MRQGKRKERERDEILLSAYAGTLQALILHLAEKAAECTTWKRVCSDSDQKTCFLAKYLVAKGLTHPWRFSACRRVHEGAIRR